MKEPKIFTYKSNVALYSFLLILKFSILLGDCNFKTENYINKLINYEHIKNIEIKLNSKKFIKLNLKAHNDRSQDNPSSSPRISKNYKKYFFAKIRINYDFGSCSYESKIKITGDQIDHLRYDGNYFFPSLKISLLKGNILHNTQFKLFNPSSRNYENEIIGTKLIKKLGFLAPDTFMVDVFINGFKTKYIFQEDFNKNFLEKNHIRETLILKTNQDLDFIKDFPLGYFEDIRAVNIKNDNILAKNKIFNYFGILALSRLNESYFKHHQSDKYDRLLHNPNKEISNKKNWDNFNLLMLALGAEHSVDILNRIVIYDILEDDFIPIYYDGNILLPSLDTFHPYKNTLQQLLNRVDREEIISMIKRIQNLKTEPIIDKPLNNLEKIYLYFLDKKNIYQNSDIYQKKDSYELDIEPFLSYKGVKQNFFYFNGLSDGFYSFNRNKIENILLKESELTSLLINNRYNNVRSILMNSNVQIFNTFMSLQYSNFFDGKIFFDSNTDIKIDNISKSINILSNYKNPFILFYKINLPEDWKIYSHVKPINNKNLISSKINNFGFTGCLNFYKVTFKNNELYSSHATCEDSINIINSKGIVSSIIIQNSLFDALDIDFSKLKISKININNAGNDCVDLSWGIYKIREVFSKKCNDKGLSIGENSRVNIDSLNLSSSSIGVASKDSSVTNVSNFYGEMNLICSSAYNKKNEFFNSKLVIKNNYCFSKN